MTECVLLDLSFNNIRMIEGLDCLLKLEVLNLSNNKISVIENMDMLEKLTHFNLANNCLENLDNVSIYIYILEIHQILCFFNLV